MFTYAVFNKNNNGKAQISECEKSKEQYFGPPPHGAKYNTRLKIALNVQCMNLVSMIKVSRLDVIHPACPSVFQALFFLQEVPLKVNS